MRTRQILDGHQVASYLVADILSDRKPNRTVLGAYSSDRVEHAGQAKFEPAPTIHLDLCDERPSVTDTNGKFCVGRRKH